MKFRMLPADKDIGYIPYFWLVYIGLFVYYALAQHFSPLMFSLNGAGFVCFLFLYFRGYWLKGNRLWPIIVGLMILGLVFMPINPGGNVFFIYAAAFLGETGKPSRGFIALFLILVFAGVEAILFSLMFYVWIPALVFPLIIGAPNIHFAERKRLRRKLLKTQDEVEQMAKIAERERIARDLHDLLGHTLSVTVLKAELAGKLIDQDILKAKNEIQEIESIARNALKEVREAVEGYRSYGIEAEMAQVKRALNTSGIQVDSILDLSEPELNPALERTLALCLREATTNILRHAQATTCQLKLISDEHHVELCVSDNGQGFEPEMMGSGLKGMKERVTSICGSFELDFAPGTRITIQIPLVNN